MNYMADVAKMLGVEIGEEFKIKGCGYSYSYKYKLTEEHLEFFTNSKWYAASATLVWLLNGQAEVIKLPKPILNNVEKKYLSYVIKPFREDVLKIAKFESNNLENKEVIAIKTQDGNTIFPPFEKGVNYEGMKLNQEYTLEELDL